MSCTEDFLVEKKYFLLERLDPSRLVPSLRTRTLLRSRFKSTQRNLDGLDSF